MKLSAVVLTKNEEENISRALQSLSFCDEIIVIDDGSTDKTIEIAKKQGAIVLQRELKGDFAAQRNFGLNKSGGEWVLFIDADEEVSRELAVEIQKETKKNSAISVYYIKRRDFGWGRELKHGEIQSVRKQGLIRLVRRDSGAWLGSVHETFQTSEKIGSLTSFLNHYPHKSLTVFLQHINFYTSLRAKELFKQKKSIGLFELITWPFGKFLMNYFIKGGFLDGPAGFAYAFLMSFHSFLVRTKLMGLYNYSKHS